MGKFIRSGKGILTITAFVLLVILAGFYLFDHLGDGENSRALGNALTTVDESDPVSDVRQNIQNGDTRYIGLMGCGLYFPGLPSDQQPSKFRVLPGTSDVVESRYYGRLLDRAHNYAANYNAELHSLMAKAAGEEAGR